MYLHGGKSYKTSRFSNILKRSEPCVSCNVHHYMLWFVSNPLPFFGNSIELCLCYVNYCFDNECFVSLLYKSEVSTSGHLERYTWVFFTLNLKNIHYIFFNCRIKSIHILLVMAQFHPLPTSLYSVFGPYNVHLIFQ